MRSLTLSSVVSMLSIKRAFGRALRSPSGKREAGQCSRAVRLSEAHEGTRVNARAKLLGAFSYIHTYIRVTNVILRGREDATCGGGRYITFVGIMLLA